MTHIKPMLAFKIKEEEGDFEFIKFPVFMSPKFDGVRGTIQGGRVYSRTLKLIPNSFTQRVFGNHALEGLDGELVVGSSVDPHVCDITRSGVMKKLGEPDVHFYVFDKLCSHKVIQRLVETVDQLAKSRETMEHPARQRVHLVKQRVGFCIDDVMQYEAEQLALGYEGICLRWEEGFYKEGRSTARSAELFAIKRFEDAEAVVLDTFEQQENTNPQSTNELGRSKRSTHKAGKVGKGTLGGFVCTDLTTARMSFNLATLPKGARVFNIGTGPGLTADKRA